MKDWSILHITDFHIDDPSSENEFLRDSFYDEYIKLLFDSILSNYKKKIDLIIITGDFINEGKIINFDHAYKIIMLIAKKCEVPITKVIVCNGNHDLDLTSTDYKLKYLEFSKKFANANNELTNCLNDSVFVKFENLNCLMFNSANCDKGNLIKTEGSIDDFNLILTKVKQIPSNEFLIIGSHFPVYPPRSGIDIHEESDFINNHIWRESIPHVKRIEQFRSEDKTIWLFGDIHRSEAYSINNNCYFYTGKFGGIYDDDSQLRKQARIISFNDSTDIINYFIFNYEMPGHVKQPFYGQWECLSDSLEIHTGRNIVKEDMAKEEIKNPKLQLISRDLENEILNCIQQQQLYFLGRFKTSSENNYVLSWVSIAPLLNTKKILKSLINYMGIWLQNQLNIEQIWNTDDSIIIGLDSCGAILASQLSVRLGIMNFCIVSRADGKYHTQHEFIRNEMIDVINSKKNIIIISDVISTGVSIKKIYDRISSQVKSPSDKKWYALSIIHDPTQKDKIEKLDFIESHGSACISLKMPIISKDELPGEELLPSNICFI